MKNENGFPSLLERFFTQRLIAQRRVSSHTIASYRDTFRLLLQFVEKRLHKPPSGLALTDLDPSVIGAFLDELEKGRGNGARSRNLRLTAIRSFYRYAAQKPVAAPGVIGHDVPSGSVERNQAGLAKLCLADGEDALTEIHIRLLQLEHLADTQTCHCQQSEQAVVCTRPETPAGR